MLNTQESLTGTIERVTYHSEETGFCVLAAKIIGQKDLVNIVGHAIQISPGHHIECKGSYIINKKYGLQFKADVINIVNPTTLEGIQKYLSSGMVKGIGPHYAKILLKQFGTSLFEIIENSPERLIECEGIGEHRSKQIAAAWHDQKSIRDIMIFLQSHGVGTARAVRIYKTYGDLAIQKVQENPYRLANDIRGIGFKTADALALALGIEINSLMRAQAGVRFVLQQLCNFGHCAALYEKLIKACVELLEINADIITEAIKLELNANTIIEENVTNDRLIFPAYLYYAETVAAQLIQNLLLGDIPWGVIAFNEILPWVEAKAQIKLSDSQQKALKTVLENKVSIITGGPGVGKTTIVNSLLKIIAKQGLAISLCSPTGRAAKRLQESTGRIAKTIHRLLEFEPISGGFKYNETNPLVADVIIIDEASMIDIMLFNQLLKAIPSRAAVILIGDIDQLPSVGSGSVLADLIKSQMITTVHLTEIFRQAKDSKIIINAHRINHGEMPLPNKDKNSDFFTIYCDTPETTHQQIIDLVSHRLPNYYHCDKFTDIQVLTPMNKGGLGSHSLNIELQNVLNKDSLPRISRFGWNYAPGDKVIQTVNNYDKEVFNGDIGFIERINMDKSEMIIQFDGRFINYDFDELDEISLAYAISIHKSQGSEFPIVIIPIVTQHYALLARNLLYTAVTRGKNCVVLVGQKKAIAMAVKNNRHSTRITRLAERLQEEY